MTTPINLLVIEDSAEDFVLLERQLRQDGLNARCRRVETEAALWDALDRGGCDALLSDYNVPGINVVETLLRIRQRHPELPLILVSGVVGEDVVADLLKQGLSDVVLKQRLSRLAPAIGRALREVEARRDKGASEVSYHDLFESISDAIFIQDEDGHFLEVNRAAELMYGHSRAFFVGRSLNHLAAADRNDLQMVAEAIRRALPGEPQRFEFWGARANGEVFITDMRLAAVRYKGGHAVIATARDITERKQAEHALRESEQRFASFMRHLPGFAYLKDHQRRILFVSDQFEQAFGIPLAQWLGKTNEEIWPGEVGEKIRRDDEAVLARGEPLITDEVVPTQGELRTYRTVKFLIRRSEQPPWLGGISVDVSDRRTAEQALAHQHALLMTIMNNVPTRIFWKDRELRYVGANAAFAADAGLADPRELIGKSDHDLSWRDKAELYRADDRRVMESGQARIAYEEPQSTPDGGKIWLRTSKMPLRKGQGEIWGVLGVYDDITPAKQAEVALRASEERFQLAMRASNDGLWDWDLTTDAVYYSPRWKTMLGYRDDELENHLGTWERLLDAQGKASFQALIEDCLAGRREGFESVIRMRHKAGHWVDVLCRGLLVRDASCR